MTSIDKLNLVLLLLRYLEQKPLSHRKRDVIAEVCTALIEAVIQDHFPPPNPSNDIPF